MRLRTHRPVRDGAHVVELAFVLPVFFFFIFALIDFGRGMMVSSLLTNAAREGCRLGVLSTKSTSDINTQVTKSIKNQGISDVTTTVKVNGQVKDASTANSGDVITVSLAAPVSSNSWMPGGGWLIKGNFSGQFTMPRE